METKKCLECDEVLKGRILIKNSAQTTVEILIITR